jgi:hypothetical protein
LSTFDTVEILAEFSKSVRHSLIVLESLRDISGIDTAKVNALADSVRYAHSQVTGYLVSVIGVAPASDVTTRQR